MTATQTNPDMDRAVNAMRKLREKYPQYSSIDDADLARRVSAKHPQYKAVFAPLTAASVTNETPHQPDPIMAPPDMTLDDAAAFRESVRRPAVPATPTLPATAPSQDYLRSPMSRYEDPAARESRIETLRQAEGSQTIADVNIQGLQQAGQGVMARIPTTVGKNIVSGGAQGAGRVAGMLARPVDWALGGDRAGMIDSASTALGLGGVVEDSAIPQIVQRATQGAAASLVQAYMGRLAGLGTTGQAVQFGLSAANQAVEDGRQAGLEGMDLARYAATTGAIEGLVTMAFNKLDLGGLESSPVAVAAKNRAAQVAAKSFGEIAKRFGKHLGGEMTEEQTIELINTVNNYLEGVDTETLKDPEKLGAQVAEVALSTAMVMGVAGGPSSIRDALALRRAQQKGQKTAQDAAQDAGAVQATTEPPEAAKPATGQPEAKGGKLVEKEKARVRKMLAELSDEDVFDVASNYDIDTAGGRDAVEQQIADLVLSGRKPVDEVEGQIIDEAQEEQDAAEQEARINFVPPPVQPEAAPVVREDVQPTPATQTQKLTEIRVNPEAANPATGLVSEGYVTAHKQRDGTYNLTLSNNDAVEVFPGERFKSPSEARRTLKAYNAKKLSAAAQSQAETSPPTPASPTAPQSKPDMIRRLRALGDTEANSSMTGEVLADRLAEREGAASPAPVIDSPSTTDPTAKKQAWEMSRAEYVNQEVSPKIAGKAGAWHRRAKGDAHKAGVEQAIARGDIALHPDYPELTQPATAPIAARETPPSEPQAAQTSVDETQEKVGRDLFTAEELADFDRLGMDVSKVPQRYKAEAIQQLEFQRKKESELASPDYNDRVRAEMQRQKDAREEQTPGAFATTEPSAASPNLSSLSRRELLTRMKKAGLKPTAKTTKEQAIAALEGKTQYASDAKPAPLADEAKANRRKIIEARIARGENVGRAIDEFPDLKDQGKRGAKTVHFHRGNIASAIDAAKRLKSDKIKYLIPTANGIQIENSPPPFKNLGYIEVHPDGRVVTKEAQVGPQTSPESTKSTETTPTQEQDGEQEQTASVPDAVGPAGERPARQSSVYQAGDYVRTTDGRYGIVQGVTPNGIHVISTLDSADENTDIQGYKAKGIIRAMADTITPSSSQNFYQNIREQDEKRRMAMVPVETGSPATKIWAAPGKEKAAADLAAKMGRIKPSLSQPTIGPRKQPKPAEIGKEAKKPEQIIAAVRMASAKTDTRYARRGFLIDGTNMVASDGRRLFIAKIKKGQFGKDGYYEQGKAGSTPNIADGAFPPWKDVIPKDTDVVAEISGRDMNTVYNRIRRAAITMNEQSRGMAVFVNTDGSLGFASSDGASQSEINIKSGAQFKIGMNPQFMLDALDFHAINGDTEITVGITAWNKPLVLRGNKGNVSITMPVNVEGMDITNIASPDARLSVSRDRAMSLNTKLELPSSPEFADAVSNTPAASITPDGLLIKVQRFQKAEQGGMPSVRTGVFYLPEGAEQAKHYRTGKVGYGGTERVAGDSLFRRPMFVKGATGGKAPQAAYDAVMGKGAYEKMRSDALRSISVWGRRSTSETIAIVEEILDKHGADYSDADNIVRNSSQGNQLPYAIQENIVAHELRRRGYDSIIGYSKSRKTGGSFISEIFDLREDSYPIKGDDTTIRPEYRDDDRASITPTDTTNDQLETLRAKLPQRIGQTPIRSAIRPIQPDDPRLDAMPLKPVRAALDSFAEAFGLKVQWFDGPGVLNGVSLGGTLGDTLFVNVNATDPHMTVFGHELLHVIRRQSPAIYKAFVDALEANAIDLSPRLRKIAETYRGLYADPESLAMEEFAAEVLGDQFANPDFLADLAAADPTTWGRVRAAIVRGLTKVMNFLKGNGYGTSKMFRDAEAMRRAAVKVTVAFARERGGRVGGAARMSVNHTTSGDFVLPSDPHVASMGNAVKRWFESRGWAVREYHATTGTAYYTVEHSSGEQYKIRVSDHANISKDPDVTSTRAAPDVNIVVNQETGRVTGWQELSEKNFEIVTEQDWRDGFKGVQPVAEDYPRSVRDLYPRLNKNPEPDARFSVSREPGKPDTKKIIERITGIIKQTVPEYQAIKASMKARHAAKAKAAAGREATRVKLDALRIKMLGKRATEEGIRQQAREMIEQDVPLPLRGRFLNIIEKAKTYATLKNAVRRMRSTLARHAMRQALADLRSVERMAKKPKKLSDADARKEAARMIASVKSKYSKVDAAGKIIIDRPSRITETYAAADEIQEVTRKVMEMIAEDRAARMQFKADKVRTRDQHAAQTVVNVRRAGKKAKYADPNTSTTYAANVVKRVFRNFLDITSMTQFVEGAFRGGGVLNSLMDKAMKRADNARLLHLRTITESLNAAAQKRGFQSLHDALTRMDGLLGDASTERITVTLDDKRLNLTLGQAAQLVALDPETRNLVDTNTPITFGTGRELPGVITNTDQIAAIERQLRDVTGVDVAGFIGDVKSEIEKLRPMVFRVFQRLKGWMPDMVPGYFPRKRNNTQSPQAGMAEGWRGLTQKYLENAGFGKERSQTNKPALQIDGLLSVAMSHIDEALKVIHLAEPVRNAEMVLRKPEVTTAIAETWGKDMPKRLQNMLSIQSMANENVLTPGEQALNVINQGLAGAYLTLNEGTFIRQLGGIPKLIGVMPTRLVVQGMPGIFSKRITNDILSYSGYGWSRYALDAAARHSPIKGSAASEFVEVDPGKVGSFRRFATEAKTGAKAMMRGVKSADIPSIWRGWQEVRQSVKLLNYFDMLVYRVAWSGYEQEAKRLYPDWSSEKRTAWVAEKAAEAIRSSQNGSSVMDMTEVSAENRGNLIGSSLLFTSDPQKSLNMLYQAAGRGTKDFAAAATGIGINAAWSGLVATGGLAALYGAIGLMLRGDDDEEDWRELLGESYDKGMNRALRDAAGVFPFADKAVEAMQVRAQGWRDKEMFDASSVEVMNEIAKASFELAEAVAELPEDKQDKFARKMFNGITMAVKSTSAATGNPMLMPAIRAETIYRKATDTYERKDAMARAVRLMGEGESERARSVISRWNASARGNDRIKFSEVQKRAKNKEQ